MKEIYNQRLRNWCFTDFGKTEWKKLYEDYKEEIRYLCVGIEHCPTTARTHYQGWIQFEKPKTMSSVKKITQSLKIHLEGCRGNPEQNTKYCKKDKDWEEYGKYKTQGQRTDLLKIQESIEKGSKIIDIARDNFHYYLQYGKAFARYKQMIDKEKRKKFRKLEVTHIWGNTGSGKTRMALEASKDYYKIQGDELQWWDGYEGEDTLVIDEYDNNIKLTKLLGILDGYELRLPIKGGFTWANWTKVYITSNYKELHGSAKTKHREALQRRITRTIEIAQSA